MSPYSENVCSCHAGHCIFWSLANVLGKGGVSEGVLQSRTSPLAAAKYWIYYNLYLYAIVKVYKNQLQLYNGHTNKVNKLTTRDLETIYNVS